MKTSKRLSLTEILLEKKFSIEAFSALIEKKMQIKVRAFL